MIWSERVKSSHSLVEKVIRVEGQDSANGSIEISTLRPPLKPEEARFLQFLAIDTDKP